MGNYSVVLHIGRTLLDRWRRVALVLGVNATVLAVNVRFPTTFEWDAVIRAMQAEEIIQFGVHWYWASPHYVWLPAWQSLPRDVD